MKKALLTLAASSTFIVASSSQAALILTGIIDGPLSGGTPKAIELYATTDIPDLSLYGVELVSNAGSSAGAVETFFSGSILAGQYYYVASEAVEFANVFGFAPNLTTGDVNHNGDDDFYIYGPDLADTPGATLIDVWGGSDGLDNSGEAYDVLDGWAYRKDNTGPNTTFTVSEWTFGGVDSLDGLTASETAAAVPFGTYAVVPEPSTALLGGLGALVLLRRRR